MSAAAHLLVLVSVIVGLALTDILESTHKLVHARERVRFDWLPVGWAVLLFYVIVQLWWGTYGAMEAESQQTYFGFAFRLLIFVTFYLLASSVLPDVEAEGVVDMRAHYFENRTWFFLLAALNVALLIVDTFRRGAPLLHAGQVFRGVFLLIFLTLVWTENRRFHAAALALMFVLVTVFIIRFSLRIG